MEKLPNSLISAITDRHCGVSWGLIIELGIWESKQWSHLIVDMRTSDDRPAFSSYHLLQLSVHRWNCLLKYTDGYIAVRCVAWEQRQAEWSQSSHCYGASCENNKTGGCMNIAAFLGHYNRKLNPKERENWKLPRLLLPLIFTVLMSPSVDGNCSPSCQYWHYLSVPLISHIISHGNVFRFE